MKNSYTDMAEAGSSNIATLGELFPLISAEIIQDVLIESSNDLKSSLEYLLSISSSSEIPLDATPSNPTDSREDLDDFDNNTCSMEFQMDPIYHGISDYEEEVDEDEDNPTDLENLQTNSSSLIPRSYQLELFEHAKERNSILVLGTGSGKTFISIMLIKEFGNEIQGTLAEGGKRTVFVVNSVPLVYQQALAIADNTPYRVGKFEGSMDVDNWSDEKWAEELDKYEVLVMVAQIFHDLLCTCRLVLSNVNLLIMDECHHATGSHPMREAMRFYSEQKRQNLPVPRVMGLTACIIHRKCSVRDVEKLIREVEIAMDCSLVTATNQEEVRKHATNPDILVISYHKENTSVVNEILEEQIRIITNEMNEVISQSALPKRDQANLTKTMRKILRSISKVLDDLGKYCLMKAINVEVDYLKEFNSDLPLETIIYQKFGNGLSNLHRFLCERATASCDPLVDTSNKVKRLLEIFKQCKKKESLYAIVFVERRNMAKILSELLNEISLLDPELSFIKTGCIIGGNQIKEDFRVRMELKKQKEVLDSFRDGKLNVIVSTSVLEEGVDIRRCNMVIRFDPPMNFRSFIQSLGRARAEMAYYVICVPSNDSPEMKEEVEIYLTIRQMLTKLCHDRSLPTMDEITQHFDDEVIESFAPFGPTGPKVSSVASLQLVNKYCSKLPQDKFTRLYVDIRKQTEEGGNLKIGLKLPINAPIKARDVVWGNRMPNNELAKQSASIELCKKLFYLKELNDKLLPRKPTVEKIDLSFFSLPKEEVDKNKPMPGTRKRRQVYPKFVCPEFSYTPPDFHLHKIKFSSSPVKNLQLDCIESSLEIGFLCFGKMDVAGFPLHSHKWGSLDAEIEYLGPTKIASLDVIGHFHRIVMESLLSLDLDVFEFNASLTPHCLYIVLLNHDGSINLTYLNRFSGMTSLFTTDTLCDPKLLSSSTDIAVFPKYRAPELFYIERIEKNLNPKSPFPDFKKKYSSYEEFYKIFYGIAITDLSQPLISCKHFPRDLNYLTPKEPPKSVLSDTNPRFVPELCFTFALPASLWWKMLCVPSILHRANGLLVEQHLLNSITPLKRINRTPHRSRINYHSAESIVDGRLQGRTDNLCVSFCRESEFVYYPGLMLQALTPTYASDNFNLERLEVLGDSFLKHEVGKFLFIKQSSDHEGFLTLYRSSIVSNKTLYSLAKQRKLPLLYQSAHLGSSRFAMPFGFIVKREVEEMLRQQRIPPFGWTSFKDKNPLEIPEEERLPPEEVHNPCAEQLVPDKCVADSVEALIGAMLLAGGEKAALDFMFWLGFEFLKETVEMPATAMLQFDSLSFGNLHSLYAKLRLSEVERKFGYVFREKSFLLQAFTHPSSHGNKVTECYQRLKFLGDSVLDYLVTGFIHSNQVSNHGQMTDLRSHYVKNETLAKVAMQHKLHVHMDYFSPLLDSAIRNFSAMLEKGEVEFNWESDVVEPEDVDVPKALGDIVESFIGAVFVDSGCCLQTTWNLVKLLMGDVFEETRREIPVDCVRMLYERCPSVTFAAFFPDEDKPAEAHFSMKGHPTIIGRGKNRRTAKQAAAKKTISYLDGLK